MKEGEDKNDTASICASRVWVEMIPNDRKHSRTRTSPSFDTTISATRLEEIGTKDTEDTHGHALGRLANGFSGR